MNYQLSTNAVGYLVAVRLSSYLVAAILIAYCLTLKLMQPRSWLGWDIALQKPINVKLGLGGKLNLLPASSISFQTFGRYHICIFAAVCIYLL